MPSSRGGDSLKTEVIAPFFISATRHYPHDSREQMFKVAGICRFRMWSISEEF